MVLKRNGGPLERRMSFSAPFTHQFTAMTVPCVLQIYAKSSESVEHLAMKIEENTHRLEDTFNFYSENSWLSKKLNRRLSNDVDLDEESLAIFKKIKELSHYTQGCFDPTIGSVKKLLNAHPNLSREEAYARLNTVMGNDSWQMNASGLHVFDSRTQFDLGGVIKEIAVDQAVKIAKQHGIDSMLVNFGGDIRALGRKPDESPFNVAVLNPKQPDKPLFVISICDEALTTSAHYERRFQFGGENSSHILAEKGHHQDILSVTVVAPSAFEAGALSTSLTLNPHIDLPDYCGVAFIDSHLNVWQDKEFIG